MVIDYDVLLKAIRGNYFDCYSISRNQLFGRCRDKQLNFYMKTLHSEVFESKK